MYSINIQINNRLSKALVTNTLANAVRTIFHHYVNGQKIVRKGICDQGFKPWSQIPLRTPYERCFTIT